MAYAIGLITTDGNLSSDERHIDFTSTDRKLVQTFKKCLDLKNKIGIKTNGRGGIAYRVQFGNVKFYKQLENIGLTSRKSKTIGKIQIPNKYFFDFLRGELDGDGYIKRYFDPVYKNSLRLYTRFTCASLEHTLWLQNTIEGLLGIKGFITKHSGAFDLTYSKKDSIKLLKKIYYKSNLPCLKRKLSIARSFI